MIAGRSLANARGTAVAPFVEEQDPAPDDGLAPPNNSESCSRCRAKGPAGRGSARDAERTIPPLSAEPQTTAASQFEAPARETNQTQALALSVRTRKTIRLAGRRGRICIF